MVEVNKALPACITDAEQADWYLMLVTFVLKQTTRCNQVICPLWVKHG